MSTQKAHEKVTTQLCRSSLPEPRGHLSGRTVNKTAREGIYSRTESQQAGL